MCQKITDFDNLTLINLDKPQVKRHGTFYNYPQPLVGEIYERGINNLYYDGNFSYYDRDYKCLVSGKRYKGSVRDLIRCETEYQYHGL